jgi:hypothetical protein
MIIALSRFFQRERVPEGRVREDMQGANNLQRTRKSKQHSSTNEIDKIKFADHTSNHVQTGVALRYHHRKDRDKLHSLRA